MQWDSYRYMKRTEHIMETEQEGLSSAGPQQMHRSRYKLRKQDINLAIHVYLVFWTLWHQLHLCCLPVLPTCKTPQSVTVLLDWINFSQCLKTDQLNKIVFGENPGGALDQVESCFLEYRVSFRGSISWENNSYLELQVQSSLSKERLTQARFQSFVPNNYLGFLSNMYLRVGNKYNLVGTLYRKDSTDT